MIKDIRFSANSVNIDGTYNGKINVDVSIDSYDYDEILSEFDADDLTYYLSDEVKAELFEKLKEEYEPETEEDE